MTSIRLDMELTTLDATGALVYVEAHAASGAQVGLYLTPETAAQLGALAAGQRLALTLELPAQAAAPSLRERMQPTRAASPTPRSAATATTPPLARSSATTTPPTRTDHSAAFMASILGKPSGENVIERDIDDEMDALLGRKKSGR